MRAKTNQITLKLLSAFFAVIMVLSTVIFAPKEVTTSLAADATVQKYQDQIAALDKQKKDLQSKINASKNEANKASETKKNLDTLIYTLETKITTCNALVAELDAKIAETNENIAAHEEQIRITNEKLIARMRASHENGNSSYLGMLFGADSISDFLSRMDRVNAILEYDKNLKSQYILEKQTLEKEKEDLNASIQMQQETLKTLEKDKIEAESQAKQAEQYYNSLKSNEAQYQAEYNKARAEEAKLDAELESYLKKIQEQNSSQVTADGEFMWPLPTGKGIITCRFGGKDPNGAPHYDLDVALPAGNNIYAANDGTVLTATWHWSYGYYIVIDHGNGRSTLYAHCSALNVKAQQTVSKGQTIGKVGSTGFSTGSHLHFEFRVGGKKVDPLSYVKSGI